ncbi:MAG TPA: TolC family protein [Dissulfurispiraceae bacterium]|nr:TolC family protein [Dissulfurispiraceae bacterium]
MRARLRYSSWMGSAVVAFGLWCLIGASADAEEAVKAAGKAYTLDECIAQAVAVSPEIGEARQEVAVYRAKKDQADGAQYPQIEALALAGPSPEAKKEDISPVVKTDLGTSINGIFGRADVTLTQPIYTFGKISSYQQAAESGIKVAEAATAKKTSDIVLRTKELYYGLALAKDLRNLALEIKDDLEKSVKQAQKQIDNNSPYADELNLFKLRTFLGETNRNLNEVDKNIAMAKDALATSMGLPRGTDIDIADSSLTGEALKPGNLSDLLATASMYRPEMEQLKQGLKARQALVDAEKSSQYPALFAGLKGVLAGATNRDNIKNTYIYDPIAGSYGAAFLGLKWAFDFGITKGRIREAEAEYAKLVEKKRFADEAIPFQVRKAYLEYDESSKSITETDMATQNAKKWLVTAMANFDLGVGEAKDVADAAVAYATAKSNNLKSKYNQRMSYANILYTTGTDRAVK